MSGLKCELSTPVGKPRLDIPEGLQCLIAISEGVPFHTESRLERRKDGVWYSVMSIVTDVPVAVTADEGGTKYVLTAGGGAR